MSVAAKRSSNKETADMSDATTPEQAAIEACEQMTSPDASVETRTALLAAFADGGVVRVTLAGAPTVLVKMVDD